MKPVKSLVPLAKWLLRLSVGAIVYLKYFNFAAGFSFNGMSYFVALAFVVFATMLIVGGVMKTAKLSVISGLLITITSLVQLLVVQSFSLDNFLAVLPLASMGFYFMARGNMG